jgi:hypothetical protein
MTPTPEMVNTFLVAKGVIGSSKITTLVTLAVEVRMRSVANAGVLGAVKTDRSNAHKPVDTPS